MSYSAKKWLWWAGKAVVLVCAVLLPGMLGLAPQSEVAELAIESAIIVGVGLVLAIPTPGGGDEGRTSR
jgi:hypothetical protein